MTGSAKNNIRNMPTKGGNLNNKKETTAKKGDIKPQKEIDTIRRADIGIREVDSETRRGDSAPKSEDTETIRKVILTDEQIGVINGNAHRVAADEELRLFTASEAARILHVSRNAIYALWRDGQLDFWRINGRMATNLTAIRNFLERMRNRGCD